jgi:beta-glucosidase/6-phospho-beta-glucosidase/beta-galactosidase
MAGFESATHVNRFASRLDMIAGTRHDLLAEADYSMLSRFGMRTVRDAFRWHLIDNGTHRFDFSSALPQLKAAANLNIQVIWSLLHYGIPDDLDIFSPDFTSRFVRYSLAALKLIREFSEEAPYLVPINEISFFSWAAGRSIMFPFAEGRDDDVKKRLVKASVESCRAMRALDSRCRFVYPDPIINVVCPASRPELEQNSRELNEAQFHVWDMIAGRTNPELGGSEDLLDILGMNFYHSNQWECEGKTLDWAQSPRDSRWKPLSRIMEDVWTRYRRPLFLAETSHVGSGRAEWIREVAQETLLAMRRGIPIEGICIYPIIDRYDWDNSEHWHNSGLWDLRNDGNLTRVLNEDYASALDDAQRTVMLESGSRIALDSKRHELNN